MNAQSVFAQSTPSPSSVSPGPADGTTSPTPTPTSTGFERTVDETVQKARDFDYAFWLGTPLKIAVIILVALLIALILRLIIRRFTRSIAAGADGRLRMGKSSRSVEMFGQDPMTRARRAQRARTVGSLLQSLTAIVVAVITGMMVLTELGFNLAPVLASAGIVGIALGFGAQTLVKDYLSGFFIVIEDQFGIGDSVDLGEVQGSVEEVGLRITKIRAMDGTLWHIRNGEILKVGNSSQGWSVAVLDLPFPYEADDDAINAVIADTITHLQAQPELKKSLLEDPEVLGVQQMTGEAVTVRVTIKTRPGQNGSVSREFRKNFRHQLSRRDLAVPFEMQTVLRSMGPLGAGAVESTEVETVSGKDDARK
jgi:small-conductance mechanosensitive channel